jgi:hypothetical protein
MIRRRLVLFLGVAGACGSPSLPSGAIACGPGGECPDGMTCARELCWTDPPGEWDAGPPDAGAPDAAAATEYAREAEDYDDLVRLLGTAGSAEWVVRSDDATAVGDYLVASPNDGVNCLDSPPTDCGAVAVYQLPALASGTYYLHLRSSAPGGPTDDSVFYGIDGAVIDFTDLPDGAAWAWRHYTLGVFDDAPHELRIWVREDGAALDQILVSQSTASPG